MACRDTTRGPQRALERGDAANLSGSSEEEELTPLCLQELFLPARGLGQRPAGPESKPVQGGRAELLRWAHSWDDD